MCIKFAPSKRYYTTAKLKKIEKFHYICTIYITRVLDYEVFWRTCECFGRSR